MRLVGAIVVLAVLAGCTDTAATSPSPTSPVPTISPSATPTPTDPTLKPSTPTPTPAPRPTGVGPVSMSIPAIGVRGLRVVAYTGTADDRPGTKIQDRGVAASPRGKAGGVGPGEIGNFIITGHRVSHGRPLEHVPDLQNGDHILITANGTVYDYVVTRTMTISFRKPAEKAQQNAAVPGYPGAKPTQPMITISTCATIEDHAAGNFWHDALGNPEHRINKIGVLTASHSV
ncbi:class E sortase [Kribbella jiaozuonensis]|nr:class E sortase [Kribbella jiaozuonensis]